jgi:RimJ/RimL family protein N-acetyltransferase
MNLLDRPPTDTFREGSTPVLETERLCMRAPRLEDAKQVAALVNDRRIAENTTRIPHPYAIADAREWIGAANKAGGEKSFVVTIAGEIIGGCGFHCRDGVPDLGYWLGVPFWGNGYATEMAHALMDHAFGDRGHEVLLAGARISNPASRRVLEKCGFQWAGVGLYRIRAIQSSAPFDRFRLERGIWASL